MQVLVGIIFVFWILAKVSSCSEPAEVKAAKEREHQEFMQRSREARESLQQAREEGAHALDEADKAIREATDSQKSDLERRAVFHRMTNRYGVRVDQYTMPNGSVVTCSTTISGNGPAMFKCD